MKIAGRNINNLRYVEDITLMTESKEELPRSVGAHMLLEISGEITPERMKGWCQSKNNTQL